MMYMYKLCWRKRIKLCLLAAFALMYVNLNIIPTLAQDAIDGGLEANPFIEQLQQTMPPTNAQPSINEEGEQLQIPEYSPGASLAGADYILGPGDRLMVYVNSLQERRHQVFVSPEGKIILPVIGEVLVNGMTIQQLQALLTLEYQKYLKDFKVTVVLVGLRRITIQVLGQVARPGVYQCSPLDRVSSAIGKAGGPTAQASIRTVDLLRNGQTIATLDLYKYLRYNDQLQNPKLEFGDIIFLPISTNYVKINGQVYRPGRYEIKEGEKLMDLIAMAGGLTPRATNDFIKITNVLNPDKVTSIDIKALTIYQNESLNIPLKPGDIVTVPTTPTTVTVVGHVQKPGTFAYEPGTVLSYYIGLAGGYGERANVRNLKINRWGGKTIKSKEDTEVEPGDVIVVGGLEIKGWRDYIQVAMQTATLFFIIWQVSR